MKFFILFLILMTLPSILLAQSYEEDQEDWEQLSSTPSDTEFSSASLLNDDLGEQNTEDMILPEGEETWSLSGEDVPAEEL